jgi:isopenicillin-N epimerase
MIKWDDIRQQFRLTRGKIQLAALWMSSHPECVRKAIEREALALDSQPFVYQRRNLLPKFNELREAAGQYFGVSPDLIAETDSTTMGLGLVYSGIRLAPAQSVLTTIHDFSGTREILAARHRRHGTVVDDTVRLFDDSATATATRIRDALVAAIRPETRLLALTLHVSRRRES